MMNIGSAIGTIANTNLTADTKKPEKKDRKADMSAADHTQKKGALDTFSSRFNNVLGAGYTEEKIPKSKNPKNGPYNPDQSRISPKDFGKDPGKIENLENGSAEHVRISNKDGTKNSRTIFKTDAQDTFVFEGKGWKKTENVTDLESGKKDPKHLNTGTLYEDNNGNKVLITGAGNDDSVIVDGKFSRPPKKGE